MTLARKLLPHIGDINVVLANLPYPWAKHVAALVRGRVVEVSARVEGAAKARADRTAKIEAAIELVCQALPKSQLDRRETFGVVKKKLTRMPRNYGIDKCPCDKKIREVLGRIRGRRGEEST